MKAGTNVWAVNKITMRQTPILREKALNFMGCIIPTIVYRPTKNPSELNR
jgi:hypothetical protein